MQLPTKIRIGPHDYRCIETASAHSRGEFDTVETIAVSSNQPNTQMLETLLHEIIHVINAQSRVLQSREDEEIEETVTTVIASGLCQVLRDNKAVVEAINFINENKKRG
jgi:hypothetical protein